MMQSAPRTLGGGRRVESSLIGRSIVRPTRQRIAAGRVRAAEQPPAADTGPSTSGRVDGTAATAAAVDLDDAWALLKAFTAAEARGGPAAAQAFLGGAAPRAKLRAALLAAYEAPRPAAGWRLQQRQQDSTGADSTAEVLLGVVAGDARTGVRALRDWCGALGVPYAQPECRVQGATGGLATVRGAVYIKYSSRGPACYLSAYAGRDRGVLVQLGSEQLGHFPLGFFDEARAAPPPPLE